MIASDIPWIWIWGENFPTFCKILFGHAREFWKEPMLPSGLAPSRAKFTYRQIRTFPPWTSEILEKEKIEDEDGTSAKRKLNILCGNHWSKNVDANKGFWIKRNTKRFKWFTTALDPYYRPFVNYLLSAQAFTQSEKLWEFPIGDWAHISPPGFLV